jgi:hypothetical protein
VIFSSAAQVRDNLFRRIVVSFGPGWAAAVTAWSGILQRKDSGALLGVLAGALQKGGYPLGPGRAATVTGWSGVLRRKDSGALLGALASALQKGRHPPGPAGATTVATSGSGTFW